MFLFMEPENDLVSYDTYNKTYGECYEDMDELKEYKFRSKYKSHTK